MSAGAPRDRDRARQALDTALLAAHEAEDGAALVGLYADAADQARRAGSADAEAFFLTHAYVFALDTGDPRADALHARLKAEGREE